jgi:curli production assembly/transport component CsgG
MRSIGEINWLRRIAVAALLAFLATGAAPAQQPETSFAVSGRYTAQRKPRVTVLEFENTNSQAQAARYGASVQAMLVTFLKRKSQFVVVERQKLGDVLEEWKRNQKGLTNMQPTDPTAKELLEKLDAIILGNVTLLDVEAKASVTRRAGPNKSEDTEEATQTASPQPQSSIQEGSKPVAPERDEVHGQKIEIDAKLLSRADGRIIAAAQRSGPVSCLRSIVERLGIALEQEFLRPYYGRLKINLAEPEYARVFLTPILLDTALDEEKPPAERSATVIMGGDRDVVETWTTDPTSYTIENLLSGWYSMRLERPGYEGLETEPSRWEARDVGGEVKVYDRMTGAALPSVEPDLRRFVVRVDPLKVDVIDGDARGFKFRKKGGSLEPRVKRQYRDEDFSQKPQRVILIGKKKLEINTYEAPHEYAEDETCDLFEERPAKPADYGRTYVAAGEEFDFTKFKGGELIFDNYQGETLPIGQFQMTLWEPDYQILTTDVNVRDRDERKTTRSVLVRNTQQLILETTGAQPARKLTLTGMDTGHRVQFPLDFEGGKVQNGLPVDVYAASTDVPGLTGWRRSVEVLKKDGPPIYDPQSKEKPPLKSSVEGSSEARPPFLRVKTRLTIGGRLEALAKPLDPLADNVYVDRMIREVLDILLHRKEEEERHGSLLVEVAKALVVPGSRPPAPAAPPTSPVVQDARAAEPAGQPQSPKPEAKPGKTPDASEGKEAEELKPRPLPRDPEALRSLLAERLADLDLLVLDDRDMKRLRRSPEVATVVKRYLDAGGALFAFATDEGDYTGIVGAALRLEVKDKDTNRFEIATGEIPGLRLELREKKVKVKSKRALPELKDFAGGDWHVVAYTKGHKEPRIVERGNREQGGYVAVWCDDPESFRGSFGGTVPDVEAVRSKVEEHIMNRVHELVQRRFGTAPEPPRRVGATSFP